MLDELISAETEKILKLYKTDKANIKTVFYEELSKNPVLLKTWQEETDPKNINRTKEFKNLIKKVRKNIYYSLRTYKVETTEPTISSHVSTRERDPFKDELFAQLDDILKHAETILDLGGGLSPLSFPFEKYPNIKKYVWLDKDKNSYKILIQNVGKFPQGIMDFRNENIGEREWTHYLPEGKNKFDVVFMLKLIPVINRQERNLIAVLKDVPSRYMVITGSKESMVKKQSIQTREAAILKKFIKLTAKMRYKNLDIENEFGYILSS